MARYRKKPVVIEAVQAIEDHMSLLPGVVRDHDRQAWVIRTLEGDMEVRPGDWVITGVKGERYPCKPDIFAATYEPAEPNNEFDFPARRAARKAKAAKAN